MSAAEKRESLKLNNYQIERLLSFEIDEITGNVLLDETNQPYHALSHMIKRKGINWVPGNVGYWLRRFLIKMQQEFRVYVEDKNDLFEEYGVKDEKDGVPLIKKLKGGTSYNDPKYFINHEEFLSKYKVVAEELVDLGYYPIPIDWIKLPQELDPQEVNVLMMLCEPDHSLEAEVTNENDKTGSEEKIELGGL